MGYKAHRPSNGTRALLTLGQSLLDQAVQPYVPTQDDEKKRIAAIQNGLPDPGPSRGHGVAGAVPRFIESLLGGAGPHPAGNSGNGGGFKRFMNILMGNPEQPAAPQPEAGKLNLSLRERAENLYDAGYISEGSALMGNAFTEESLAIQRATRQGRAAAGAAGAAAAKINPYASTDWPPAEVAPAQPGPVSSPAQPGPVSSPAQPGPVSSPAPASPVPPAAALAPLVPVPAPASAALPPIADAPAAIVATPAQAEPAGQNGNDFIAQLEKTARWHEEAADKYFRSGQLQDGKISADMASKYREEAQKTKLADEMAQTTLSQERRAALDAIPAFKSHMETASYRDDVIRANEDFTMMGDESIFDSPVRQAGLIKAISKLQLPNEAVMTGDLDLLRGGKTIIAQTRQIFENLINNEGGMPAMDLLPREAIVDMLGYGYKLAILESVNAAMAYKELQKTDPVAARIYAPVMGHEVMKYVELSESEFDKVLQSINNVHLSPKTLSGIAGLQTGAARQRPQRLIRH